MRRYRIWLLFCPVFTLATNLCAQGEQQLSAKVNLGYSPNIETYFIAEKLAVQHINTFVFDQKDSLYAHQPLVYFAYQHFKKYQDTPCILRIAQLLASLRDSYHDNAEILQFLLSKRPFPSAGDRYPFADSSIFKPAQFPLAITMVEELTDSLRSFYRFAHVGEFFQQHRSFYEGALREARKDINVNIFPYMEKYYGEKFYKYTIYIMPLMPITYGDDNYRAFGPTIHLPQGRVSTMVFSSSRMLSLKPSLKDYKKYGFDNPEVTHLLTVHEIGHSFVNPHVMALQKEIEHDTALFTPALRRVMEPNYIESWWVCVVEHLVRLGEIRVALAMHNKPEATRLRNLHIKQFGFILLPLLEQKIEYYEANRDKYPDFQSFLPEIFSLFHSLKPEQIDDLVNQSVKMNQATK